jgi:phage regulator Rha-like protein
MNEIMNNQQTMSSREIAEITGKEHRHVLRDCDILNEHYEKMALPNFGQCSYKAENGQNYREYLLTRMQTFDLMTGYSIELRIKVNRRWEQLEMATLAKEPEELLYEQVKLLLEQKKRLVRVEEKVKEIDARTMTKPDYFTIVGYATINGMNINIKQAANLGRKAAKMCKDMNMPMDSMPDPRFGRVGLYPTRILKNIFNSPIN